MKKVFAAAMALLMAFAVLTACSNKGNTGSSSDAPPPVANNNTTNSSSGGNDAQPAPAPAAQTDALPAATITVLFEGSNVSDDGAVVAAVNARLKELGTNITFKPIWGTWGDFNDKAVNALDTGDTGIDIMFSCSWTNNTYINYARKGTYVRLDDPNNDLLSAYGQDVKAALPELLWNGFMVDGPDGLGIYGVPGYKDYTQLYCWDVNNTLLTELGFDINSFTWNNESLFDPKFEEALAAAKAKLGANFYPLLVEAEVFARSVCNSDTDPTGTGTMYLGFEPQNPANPTHPVVGSRYDQPIYERYINKMREFYLAGYIDPRMANPTQANDTLMALRDSGEYLFNTQAYAYGYDATASAERGIDARFPAMSKPIVSTGSVQGSGYVISAYSKNKAQAMQFLNYWNTDAQLATLLAFGVEGTQYTTNSDGTITFNQAARSAYSPWRNGMANIFILPPEDVNGPNYWNEFKAYNNAGVGTAFLGFPFNPEPVKNEIAALTSVNEEYFMTLLTGAVDPATALPEFRAKLQANGIQKLIDEFNRQVDAYLAAK